MFKGKGNFFDKKLPAGFTPYGVHVLENTLIVTYRGPNGVGGAVDKFTNDGKLLKRFGGGSNGASGRFQSPWGAAVISMQNAADIAGFGPYAPDVLIGNYRSGEIDAYNFTSGKYDGTLGTYASGGSKLVPLVLPGLRTIHFGPGLSLFGENPPKSNSPCSSPKIQSMGIMSRFTARSRLSSWPSDPLMSRTGFVDPSVRRPMARAGESPAVVWTALRYPENTSRTGRHASTTT